MSAAEHDPLTLTAATWLAGGIVLLGLTPLPLHDATLGWSAAFWLLVAPFLLLVARYVFAPRRMPATKHRKTRLFRRIGAQAVRRSGTNTIPILRGRRQRQRAAA
jgi:hypothetical protein